MDDAWREIIEERRLGGKKERKEDGKKGVMSETEKGEGERQGGRMGFSEGS